jgi:site-specific recombinase XerD
MVSERNLARNTQKSYRDTLCLLLPFVARGARRRIDQLRIRDLSAARVCAFLRESEESRSWGAATRNQRLAAVHSLGRFIALRSPTQLSWYGELKNIPLKKVPASPVTYLEKDEMDALLEAPDQNSAQGRRDHALLLFMYNTGARADEVAHVQINDLDLGSTPDRDVSSVLIRGKGNKTRRCPLWANTVVAILPLISKRATSEHVFLNRRKEPLTRFGIHALVERYAAKISKALPAIGKKCVSPHAIRHTTATHLLRARVDINTIRAWLGHVCLSTTNIYAEVDLEMKAKALATCEVKGKKPKKKKAWREDRGLMDFLKTL